jgi:hypothetical protein
MVTAALGGRERRSHAVLRERFLSLNKILVGKSDFFDKEHIEWPPLGKPNIPKLRRLALQGKKQVPRDSQEAYFEAFISNLPKLSEKLVSINDSIGYFFMTILANAAIQLAPESPVAGDARRLRAVISDIYDSYLYTARRNDLVGPPTAKALPPLGAFIAPHPMFEAPPAPWMLTVGQIAQFTDQARNGFAAGAVGLPSGYTNHPILWGVLAHEIGGHDVLHADANLVDQLKEGIHQRFSGRDPQYFSALWGHWCEEAASEVCGVLNVGPSFGILSVIYHAIIEPLRARTKIGWSRDLSIRIRRARNMEQDKPTLGYKILKNPYRGSEEPDSHPVAMVIPDLIIGAINELRSLSEEPKKRYISQLEDLAIGCRPDCATIAVESGTRVPGFDGHLPEAINADQLRISAREVGTLIARLELKSLKNKSLEEIETWDDKDECAAQQVATRLANGNSIASDDFDDAQTLAGALIAILRQPRKYDDVSDALRLAFDYSYESDPLLGSP